MVSDQHRLPGQHGWIEAAGGVGQDDDPGTGDHRSTDRMDDLGRRTAFVEVGAPDEKEDPVVTDPERTQLAMMAGNRRHRESRKICGRPLGFCGPEPVGDTLPARAEDDRHVVGWSARPARHLCGSFGRELVRVRCCTCDRHGAKG